MKDNQKANKEKQYKIVSGGEHKIIVERPVKRVHIMKQGDLKKLASNLG